MAAEHCVGLGSRREHAGLRVQLRSSLGSVAASYFVTFVKSCPRCVLQGSTSARPGSGQQACGTGQALRLRKHTILRSCLSYGHFSRGWVDTCIHMTLNAMGKPSMLGSLPQ